MLFDITSQRQYRITSNVPVDSNRDLAATGAFLAEDGTLIHAADIASRKLGFRPALEPSTDDVSVELQYPGYAQRERYVEALI